jgi:DNA repair protein RadC
VRGRTAGYLSSAAGRQAAQRATGTLGHTRRGAIRPVAREQIKSPADVAGLLMVEMGALGQEELRTVLLDMRNRVMDVVTVYRGSLNTTMIRIGEIFKETVRQNSAALILAHNHPSSLVDPSPEDVLMTRHAAVIIPFGCDTGHCLLWAELRHHQCS